MTKKEIRTLYKQKRSELTGAECDTMSMQIANQLLQLPIWQYHTYHLFLSIEKLCEINTEYILDILYGKDKQVVVPKMNPETKTLRSIALTDDTLLCTNHWGIAEPENGSIRRFRFFVGMWVSIKGTSLYFPPAHFRKGLDISCS